MPNKRDYFETFCSISLAFGTAATVDQLLELIVQSATQTMEAKAACLFLADYKQDVFIPRASYGLSKDYIHASPIKAKKLQAVLRKKGHLFFEDATKDPRLENHDAKKKEGIASILTVPVIVDDRQIGLLSIYTAKKSSFSEQDIIFIRALASNGGIAFKKARLLDRIEKNSNLFLDLASAINSSLDIKEILYNMSEKTCTSLGMKGVAIRLLNEEGNSLKLIGSYGLSDDFLRNSSQFSPGKTDHTTLGKTTIIEDVNKTEDHDLLTAAKHEGALSMIRVPMKLKASVIGTMEFYSDYARKYPQDFILVVEALAHTGALAIQNASMYLLLQEDKKSLEEDIWSHRLYF